jgi:hypothetical protein
LPSDFAERQFLSKCIYGRRDFGHIRWLKDPSRIFFTVEWLGLGHYTSPFLPN